MNYRKYFYTPSSVKCLVNIEEAYDAQILSKINYILVHADFEHNKQNSSIYNGDNMKKLYKNNLQFRLLLSESTKRRHVSIELEEIYNRLI